MAVAFALSSKYTTSPAQYQSLKEALPLWEEAAVAINKHHALSGAGAKEDATESARMRALEASKALREQAGDVASYEGRSFEELLLESQAAHAGG